jgi:hypothetical protein
LGKLKPRLARQTNSGTHQRDHAEIGERDREHREAGDEVDGERRRQKAPPASVA